MGRPLRQALLRAPRGPAVVLEDERLRLVRYGCVAGVPSQRLGLLGPGDRLPSEDPCPADETLSGWPPQHHFPFASTSAEVSAAKGRSGHSIKVAYQGDSYFMGYSYDEKTKRYRRSLPWGRHVLADGTRVTTDNVLVIKARQHCGKIFQGNGGKEPLYNIAGYAGTFY